MAALVRERLGPVSSYVPGPANVGLVELGEGGALLVDAGNDADAGRRLLRLLEAEGLTLRAVAATHSNADHVGGLAFLQSRTGCGVAATRIEAAFIENPILEPAYLWGAAPPAALRNKFLMAEPARVPVILEPPCAVPGTQVQAIPLPGHFFGMVGYLTPDRVFFAADTVASPEILAKYHVFYLHDVGAHLETLAALEALEAEVFVPSHAPPTADIRPLVEANRAKIMEIAAFLLGQASAPVSAEGLLARLAERYAIQLNHTQYALVGSTLRAYLTWLGARKELESWFEEGRLYHKRA